MTLSTSVKQSAFSVRDAAASLEWDAAARSELDEPASLEWDAAVRSELDEPASSEWDATAGPKWDATTSPVWDEPAGPKWDATASPEWDATASPEVTAPLKPVELADSPRAFRETSHFKAAWRYLVASLACGAFAFIYAQFSHGVYSLFMTFAFAIPLMGGAVVALALHVAHAPDIPRAARQSWALAVATLTVATCLRGIFEIAGTDSPYLIAYPLIAVAFALLAVVQWKRGSRMCQSA